MNKCAVCGSKASFFCKHCKALFCGAKCKDALIQNIVVEKIDAVFFDFDKTLTRAHVSRQYREIKKFTDRDQVVQAFRDLMVDADAFVEFVERLVAAGKTVAISSNNSIYMIHFIMALLFDPESYPVARHGDSWKPSRDPETPFRNLIYGMGDSRIAGKTHAKVKAVEITMGEQPQGYSNVLFLDDDPGNRAAVMKIGCQAPVVDPSVGLTLSFIESLVVSYNLYE